MMNRHVSRVRLAVFAVFFAGCGRDPATPNPPPPFPSPVSETELPSSLCRRSLDAFLGPSPEELGAPPPIAQPPTRPRLPGIPASADLGHPHPGVQASGAPEVLPRVSDFPALPEGAPGTGTFYWTALTPCSRILDGTFVPPEAAAATGMVAVQTAPGSAAVNLYLQVSGLPEALFSAERTLYQPWLAAHAADGRYLFTALAPFQVTSAVTLIVRPMTDPLLDAAGSPGVPVEITSRGLQTGAPLTDPALAFPLIYYRFWFITAVPDHGASLPQRPTIVLSGEATFPVPQLRTTPQ